MMLKMVRRSIVASAVTLFAWSSTSALAQANVLDQLPSDALVVIKINNWGTTEGKMGKWVQDIGLAGFQPQAANPITSWFTEAGIEKGLAPDGDIAFAFISPEGGEEAVADDEDAEAGMAGAEQNFVMVLPVRDYNEFLTNFNDAEQDGDVHTFTSPQNGMVMFSTSRDGYAVIAPRKETLSQKSGISVAGKIAPRQIDAREFVVYMNIPAMREKYLPELKANRQKIMDRVEREMLDESSRTPAMEEDMEDVNAEGEEGEDTEQQAELNERQAQARRALPLVRSVVNQGLNIAEQFLTEAQAATLSISYGERGIDAALVTEFNEGSQFAKQISSLKGEGGSLLNGLPSGKYLALSGYAADSGAASAMFDQYVGPVLAEVKNMGPDFAPVAQLMEGYRTLLSSTSGGTMGWLAPNLQAPGTALMQTVQISRGNAAAIMDASKQMLRSQEAVMKLATTGDVAEAGAEGQSNVTFTDAAKTIEGVKFNQFKADMNIGQANSREAMQMAQMMQMFYGPEGMTGYMASLDNNTVVGGMGVTDQVLADVVKSAKAGNDATANNAPLQATNKSMPQGNRLMVAYVALDEIVKTGLAFAAQNGFPLQVQMEDNLSPIGYAVSTDGSALRVDGHLPTDLTRNLGSAVMQVMMGMMGNRGGGGAGGGGAGGMEDEGM